MARNRNKMGFAPPEEGGDGFNQIVAELRSNPDGLIDLFDQPSGEELCAYIESMSRIIGSIALKDDFELAA